MDEKEPDSDVIVENLLKKLETLDNSLNEDMTETIELLRKSGKFSERDLQHKYLIARDCWFERHLVSDENFDGIIDAYDQFLPFILHDHGRLFADSDTIVPGHLQKFSSSDKSVDDGSIINSWLLLKISSFISLLRQHLTVAANNHKGSSICHTYARCLKMTQRMGRIGFDIEPQLIPLFDSALSLTISSSIEKATVKFELSFATSVSISIESLTNHLAGKSATSDKSSFIGFDEPPASFGDYPIFMSYCYDIIESISWMNFNENNELSKRHMSLFVDIHKALNCSLLRVSKALSTLSHADYKSNHPILTRLTILYITELIPYMSAQCEKLIPEKDVLTHIGLTKLDLNLLRNTAPQLVKSFGIDTSEIVAPLRLILPDSMSIIGE